MTTGWTVQDRIPVGTIFSAPVQTGPGAHPASYTMGTGFFSGVKRPGLALDHPPHLAPRLKKSRAIALLHLWAFVACSRMNFTFTFTKIFKFQVPYWEPTNFRRDRTEFSTRATWRLGFMHRCFAHSNCGAESGWNYRCLCNKTATQSLYIYFPCMTSWHEERQLYVLAVSEFFRTELFVRIIHFFKQQDLVSQNLVII